MQTHSLLAEQTAQAFSPSGALASAAKILDQPFQPREGQQQMAAAIANAIALRTSVVVEAGTGVGKTFAYLVPAVLSGARVVVSTATKTLQDQLFSRDLPVVTAALGIPIRTALLKGRSSYLCLNRMDAALHGEASAKPLLGKVLAAVSRWSKTTATGDLAEMTGLDERSPVLPLVTSTRENCLGSDCPQAKECHVNLARKEALSADIVVVNHHLFFADMAVRESGVAQILPTTEVVIFDEAHQINEIGVGFLAKQLSTPQLLDFARDLLAAGLQHARGLVDWSTVVQALEYAARDLRLSVGKQAYASRLAWTASAPDGVDTALWQQSLQGLQAALAQADAALGVVMESNPEFTRLAERALELSDLVQAFIDKPSVDSVRWLEVDAQIKLVESPLDIAHLVKKQWFPESVGHHENNGEDAGDNAGSQPGQTVSQRSWIFTSATLGSDERLSWFLEGCGLQSLNARQLAVHRVSSPFKYEVQSALYVPSNFPKPNEPEHTARVADVALDAVQKLGGRTLILTTTLRALRQIGEALSEALQDSEIAVLIQGQQSKRELIERFRTKDSASVLVASASFWEGVDIAGDALQCVIIDKLPFPPPGDPLVDARCKRLEAQGRSSFNDYSIPEAAIALKQGTGRLIRSEGDVGVLVVCDPRLVQMGYGRRLIASLPTMPILRTPESWNDWLRLLRGVSSGR
ncbi:MAG: ATP-dependent DNA helicase [Cytophagales bacterium]|nr:ATP-dependent DNA helicase [Cytophagales bacterium]